MTKEKKSIEKKYKFNHTKCVNIPWNQIWYWKRVMTINKRDKINIFIVSEKFQEDEIKTREK